MTFLAYGKDSDKQPFSEQLAAARQRAADRGLRVAAIRVPPGYGAQVPVGPYTVEEHRTLPDRMIMIGIEE